ncbi:MULTISPECIES: DUF6917 domain-containing protein [Actinosynnema]|uniref:DUF6917 domain-containing protein n=1 Tax=Actinosynnema TaxID=40566 RepID=UPI0020A42350|nr:hypothetical protein [Actinosynnema pretiosum]MCP2098149.1 hypothetical protein [Actinosynnema pretiosum]
MIALNRDPLPRLPAAGPRETGDEVRAVAAVTARAGATGLGGTRFGNGTGFGAGVRRDVGTGRGAGVGLDRAGFAATVDGGGTPVADGAGVTRDVNPTGGPVHVASGIAGGIAGVPACGSPGSASPYGAGPHSPGSAFDATGLAGSGEFGTRSTQAPGGHEDVEVRMADGTVLRADAREGRTTIWSALRHGCAGAPRGAGGSGVGRRRSGRARPRGRGLPMGGSVMERDVRAAGPPGGAARVVGFDARHHPDHHDILIDSAEVRTGADLGLKPEGSPLSRAPEAVRMV